MPFNPLPSNPVTIPTNPLAGLRAIAGRVAEAASAAGEPVTVAADGMWGVDWEPIVQALRGALADRQFQVDVVLTADFLHQPDVLEEQFRPWLTENPVFGRVCGLPLSAYFDTERLSAAVTAAAGRADPSLSTTAHRVTLVAGPYALGAAPAHIGLYCDLHREEIIRRHAAAGLGNLGQFGPRTPGAKYKAAYYVEWPLLEAHKRDLLRRPDSPVQFYLDCSVLGQPLAVTLEELRAIVADVASRPFRCKPFFMPGVWGGRRLMEVADLPATWPNCAWDFEIVAPENAVTADIGPGPLQIPFPVLTWLRPVELMGALAYRQFGEYFPLRVNYLDTMGGTNLSLQVHPHHSYMRQEFGEPIGQDESYYIVEQKPGAKVYLGLREGTTRRSLYEAVRQAEEEHVPFEITDYANAWEARTGDLFLIPAGTVHCSGADNLVLEISSTPYWYTFKIYDYLRPDLDGKPRPINSAHAFAVIDFSRQTEWVRRHLIQEPVLLRSEPGGQEFHIGSSGMTFYAMHRLHLVTEMADETGGGFLLLTTVAGEAVQILDPAGEHAVAEIPYLETWVVPACFGAFRLRAVGDRPCQVVKTYVRR